MQYTVRLSRFAGRHKRLRNYLPTKNPPLPAKLARPAIKVRVECFDVEKSGQRGDELLGCLGHVSHGVGLGQSLMFVKS